MHLKISTFKPDIVHPTYYRVLTPSALARADQPVIITVFDMIHELFPERNDPLCIAEAKRACIKRADSILCISEHTRRDLIDRYPGVADKAFVTPLASSMSVNPDQVVAAKDLDVPFFLYVGGRDGYKNFDSLLVAWSRSSLRTRGFQLRVVGTDWLPDEKIRILQLNVCDTIVHEGTVNDSRLSILYRRSIALVYPSKYEGFGIPLLEAMQCGTPVVCSRTSSLPEVGGDAALYFDLADLDTLVTKMEALAESQSLREQCIARGEAQCQKFTWSRTAKLTVEAYERVLA